jgi:hypothetical protein
MSRPASPASTRASLCLLSRGATLTTALVEARMEVIVERAAGLDVHQGSVVAYVAVLHGSVGEA